MTTATRKDVSLPYAPYKSWKNLIDKLRTKRPLPSPFDSGFWTGLSFSGALLSVLRPTMVSLGLLDKESRPLPLLEELLDSSEANLKSVYLKLLEIGFPNYSEKLDTERMTSGQLNTYLSEFGAAGETGVKARSFFLGLVKDAGLSLSKHVSMRGRTPNNRRSSAPPQQPGDSLKSPRQSKTKDIPPDKPPQAEKVALHGATVSLSISIENPIELVTSVEDTKWLQDLLAKFHEKATLPSPGS